MATTEPAPKSKRLTLSDVLEKVLTRGHDRSSVTLGLTALGRPVLEVVVRTAEGEDVSDAERQATEVYDRLVARYVLEETNGTGGGSAGLTRNAKGETQIEVVARTSEHESLADAEKLASDTFDRLRRTYPMSTGYVGAAPKEPAAEKGSKG